jgi:glycine dehydrogenase subunit 2
MAMSTEPLLSEMGAPGRLGASLPELDVPETPVPEGLLRTALRLPEITELEAVRHFTRLSRLNYSIDTNFYPLGSCTMKYNPKVNEDAANLAGFTDCHPLIPEDLAQGSIELMFGLQEMLKAVSGFDAVSLQPAAGAHGELTGVYMIRAWHESRKDAKRKRMLIPDSAHGTNPASVAMAGFEAVTIPSSADGGVDLAALKAACDDTVAGLMITNPSTLGLFERNILEVVKIVHDSGGLVYGDGANMNALVGAFRPADAGIDVMHFNLHKTFSTPHGGGGPGAGAVGASSRLASFLPGPIAARKGVNRGSGRGSRETSGDYGFEIPENSIGRVKSFYGNFGILVRAYAYMRQLGAVGLRRVSENAVINANYLRVLLRDTYHEPYDRPCMHEFVAEGDVAAGVRTVDVAKRLIDLGFHPPTIYFPLIVHEALMIEPTESESKETLDAFAAALIRIADEAKSDPQLLHDAPHDTPVGRLDEVAAARKPVLCYHCD